MILADLVAHLGFEVESDPLEKVEKALDGIKERLNLIIGFEAVTKLYELSERFAHWGSELNITAQNIGVTTSALQGLTFAAGDFGISQEMLSSGLAHLSRSLYEARNGSIEMQTHFAKAGFTSETLGKFKNSEDALYAIADKIQAIEDPMRRMAVAQELLGRGGFRMVAFLKQGSAAIKEQKDELKKLGLELSGPQVQALVQVDSTFHKLHAILAAIGSQIASYVGPAFTFLVDKFIGLYAASKSLIDSGTTTWLDTLLYGLGFVSGVVYSLTQRIFGMAGALKDAFKKGGLGGGLDFIGDALKKAFSDENLKAVKDKLELIVGSDTFANAVKTALDFGLIVSGWAITLGATIAVGFIGAVAEAIPSFKDLLGFGGYLAKGFAGLGEENKIPGEKNRKEADDFEAKQRDESNKVLAAFYTKVVDAAKGAFSLVPLATTPQAALGGSVANTANTSVGGAKTINAKTSVTVNAPGGVAATPEQIGKHVEDHVGKALNKMYNDSDADIPNAERPHN